MRKTLPLLLLLLLCAAPDAAGQSAARIRRDAAYLQAEGRAETLHAADSMALTGLAAKVAARSGLGAELGATYLEDLRRSASRIVEGRYTVLRYLPADELGRVFAPRMERVQALAQRAEQTGDPQFYTLAYTLARSLPAYPADLLESLRRKSSGSWSVEDFTSREAEAVLAALEPRAARADARETERTARPAVRPAPAPAPSQERIVIQDTVVVERELGRFEVEHTFRRRDTVVVIPGSRVREGIAATPTVQASQPRRLHGFVLAQAGVFPEPSGGLVLGLRGDALWGGYLAARSNFRAVAPDYDCGSDGRADFGPVWTSGARQASRFTVAGGVWYAASEWLKVYAGAGYGRRTLCWEDTEGAWARVTDYSAAGPALDAGLIFSFGRFALSLGGEVIAFRQFGVSLGAGVCF